MDIYEAAPSFTEAGAGIGISRCAWKALKALGLEVGLRKVAHIPESDDEPSAYQLLVENMKVLRCHQPLPLNSGSLISRRACHSAAQGYLVSMWVACTGQFTDLDHVQLGLCSSTELSFSSAWLSISIMTWSALTSQSGSKGTAFRQRVSVLQVGSRSNSRTVRRPDVMYSSGRTGSIQLQGTLCLSLRLEISRRKEPIKIKNWPKH